MTFVFVTNTARQNLVFTISGWIEKLFYKAIDIITNIFPFGWGIVSDL